MPDMEFSAEEINEFFARLDTFASDLSPKERALLRAIFHVAADSTEVAKLTDQRSFKDEFSAAFQQTHAESMVAAYSGDEISAPYRVVKLNSGNIVRFSD